MGFLTSEELTRMGVRAGRDVKISVDARVFGADRLVVADNVRIDAFCIVSSGNNGHVRIGSHVHIASGVRLFGDAGIDLGDFSTISAGSTLYSASDDYSGGSLIGPTIPERWTSVDSRPLRLERLAAIGAHALVLPGVTMGEGSVLGAGGMATCDLDPWTVYVGSPCRALRPRLRDAGRLATEFESAWNSGSAS